MATKRIIIRGITIILPRDAKLSKKDLAARYGKGSSFNHPVEFTDQLHERIQKANDEKKEAEKGDSAKEVSKQDSEKK